MNVVGADWLYADDDARTNVLDLLLAEQRITNDLLRQLVAATESRKRRVATDGVVTPSESRRRRVAADVGMSDTEPSVDAQTCLRQIIAHWTQLLTPHLLVEEWTTMLPEPRTPTRIQMLLMQWLQTTKKNTDWFVSETVERFDAVVWTMVLMFWSTSDAEFVAAPQRTFLDRLKRGDAEFPFRWNAREQALYVFEGRQWTMLVAHEKKFSKPKNDLWRLVFAPILTPFLSRVLLLMASLEWWTWQTKHDPNLAPYQRAQAMRATEEMWAAQQRKAPKDTPESVVDFAIYHRWRWQLCHLLAKNK